MAIIKCEDCNSNFKIGGNSNPSKIVECPKCGSKELNGDVSIKDTIEAHDAIRIKAREGVSGKPFRETLSGDDYYHDKDKWVKKTRIIDRQNNLYSKIITDPVQGRLYMKLKSRLQSIRDAVRQSKKRVHKFPSRASSFIIKL